MPDQSPAHVESLTKFTSQVERWTVELDAYEKSAKDWRMDGKRIAKRYALQDMSRTSGRTPRARRFNILWSNVETMMPSLFSADPVPVAEREHRDKDPIGRLAAATLERAVHTEMQRGNLSEIMEQVTLDLLLGGRGTLWVRYDPDLQTEIVPITVSEEGNYTDPHGVEVEAGDVMQGNDGSLSREVEDVGNESCPVDYVHPDDFAHKPVKNWEELERSGWVARRLRFDRDSGVREFGEVFRTVPLSSMPMGLSDDMVNKGNEEILMQAEVWEIWDAPSRKVYHICKDYKQAVLRERDDPPGPE